jgi:hypothetical protein
MPRKPNAKVEEGYLRSLWEHIAEIEREYNAVVTITMYATQQRGVFTVEMRALEMMVLENNEPVSHSITKRLPDGGSLPFTGALWNTADKLNAMVYQSRKLRVQARISGD